MSGTTVLLFALVFNTIFLRFMDLHCCPILFNVRIELLEGQPFFKAVLKKILFLRTFKQLSFFSNGSKVTSVLADCWEFLSFLEFAVFHFKISNSTLFEHWIFLVFIFLYLYDVSLLPPTYKIPCNNIGFIWTSKPISKCQYL